MKELGGETGVLVGVDLSSLGGGTEVQGSDCHIGTIGSEEKHLRLKVKQLPFGSLNGMKIRQSLPQLYIPWTGTQVP